MVFKNSHYALLLLHFRIGIRILLHLFLDLVDFLNTLLLRKIGHTKIPHEQIVIDHLRKLHIKFLIPRNYINVR